MAFVIADRVRESSTTTGTGSIALGGAVTGYQTFDSVLDTGDTTYYTIADQGGADWEVGIGTFTSPSTLARTTILSSSNGGSIVTFTAGTKDVFISLPASRTVQSFSAGTTGFTPSTASYGAISLAGTLNATSGGTGQTSYSVGDLLYASTTTDLSKLSDVATGNALLFLLELLAFILRTMLASFGMIPIIDLVLGQQLRVLRLKLMRLSRLRSSSTQQRCQLTTQFQPITTP